MKRIMEETGISLTQMFGCWLGAFIFIGFIKIILFTPVDIPKHVSNNDEFSIMDNSVFLKILRCKPVEFFKKEDSEAPKEVKGRVTTIAFAYEARVIQLKKIKNCIKLPKAPLINL